MEYIVSGIVLLVFQILGWIGAGGYNFVDGSSFPVIVYNFVGLLGFCAIGILGAIFLFIGIKSKKKPFVPFEKSLNKTYTVFTYIALVLVSLVLIYNLYNGFNHFSIFLLIQIVGNGALISYAICYILKRSSYGLEVALLSAGISYILGIVTVLPNYLIYVKDTEYSATIWIFGYLPQLIAAIGYFLIFYNIKRGYVKGAITKIANTTAFALMTFCVLFSTLCIMGYFQIVIDELIFPLGLFFLILVEENKRDAESSSLTINVITFCRKCGTHLKEDSRFCSKCGTEIKEEQQ